MDVTFDILLKRLLPPGLAFPALPGSQLDLLLKGLARELERVYNSAQALITEANPVTMSQMLSVRREEAGLPDPCRGEPATFQEKRAEVVAKWNLQGGSTKKFIEEMCRIYGYDVMIEETASESDFTFNVHFLDDTITYFRAGQSTAGERLQETSATAVHCLINRIKPAHLYANYISHSTKTW